MPSVEGHSALQMNRHLMSPIMVQSAAAAGTPNLFDPNLKSEEPIKVSNHHDLRELK